jgi:formylglycine-generating enzyme required for sulfatase activity
MKVNPHRKRTQTWGKSIMDIQFNCPNCGKTLQASANEAGKSVACPGCQALLPVPQPQARAQAEVHFNAYRAALESQGWDAALQELVMAVKLDSKRFAPFPIEKYQPQGILGAGGFGVTFRCRHRDLKADVAVKTLLEDDLGRDVDEVLNEARILYRLDHRAIIRVLDCGYMVPAEKSHPYVVMEFFEGKSLEEYVETHGPLSSEDLTIVAREMANGLRAAHEKSVLHRDVKPANVLVRREGDGWQVKLIDFGLALKQSAVNEGADNTAKRRKTVAGTAIAGTVDYAAPEQMGRLPGVSVGPYSDIYGFGKTCCYALFKTTHLLPKHWKSLPNEWAELLENCLDQEPKGRASDFSQLLEHPALSKEGTPVTPAPSQFAIAEPQQPKPGMLFSNSLGMQFVWIPPGSFVMGSPETEQDRQPLNADETEHRVRLTKGFYMSIHPVTLGQFAAFVKQSGYKTEAEQRQIDAEQAEKEGRKTWAFLSSKDDAVNWRNPGFDQTDDHPVVCVSWNDAVAFTKWLSQRDNKIIRLPTEAEWEYACRAGTTTPFSTDDANFDGRHSNGDGEEYGVGDEGVFRAATTPVGSFPANAFGMFDMHGNVWEWCQDWFDVYPKNVVVDPEGPYTGIWRGVRGGCWNSPPGECRSASRYWIIEASASDNRWGFRVVLVGIALGFS